MNFFRGILPGLALVLATGLVAPVQAETPADAKIRELESKLDRSMVLIEQLSAKVSQLEQANAGVREVQTQSAQQSAQIEQIEKHVSEIGNSVSQRPDNTSLPIHGFADVGIVRSGEDNATFKGRKGATLGNFDLYLTPQFGDHVKSLVELVFEADRNGEGSADLERLQIGYTFSDAATAWLGRFHTPFGYWNTAFHHGAQIQISILRPRFLDFEDKGGILPDHTTGIWLTGGSGTGSGKLGYDVFVGNAPQINGVAVGSNLAAANPTGFSKAVNIGTYAGSGTLNMRQSGSTSHRTSTGVNAWFEPSAVDGLRLGLHGLRADVIDDAVIANNTLLNMFGGYFAYTAEPWEMMAEYYKFHNEDRSGGTGTHNSWASYAQIGYNINKWTPFARAERTKLDQTDNYFGVQENGRSYKRLAAGLRYDVDTKAALKVELDSTRKEALGPGLTDNYTELRFQYAIRF